MQNYAVLPAKFTTYSKDLYVLDLIRYLPSAGVCCVSPALVVYALDIESMENSKPRGKSANNFEFCIRVLDQLQDIYAAAEINADLVQKIIQSKEDQYHGSMCNPICYSG
jgi:hypothetical protein